MMYQNPGINKDVILQTIGFPTFGSDKMWLKLNQVKGTIKNSYSLKWDINEDKGYSWYGNLVGQAAKKLDTIPSNVKEIEVNVPVFNSDLSSAKECVVNFKVTNLKTKKVTYSKNIPVSIGTDKQPKYVDIKIDTSEWLKNEGDTTAIPYKLACQLTTTSGNYLDGWDADFLIDGQTPPKKDFLKFKFSYIGKNGSTYKYDFDWAKMKQFFTYYGKWKGNTYNYSENYINEQNQMAGYQADIEYNSSRTKILNLAIRFTLNNIDVVNIKGGGMDVSEVAGEYTYVKNGSTSCNNLSQITFDYGTGTKFTGFCESDSYFSLKIEK